MKILEKLLAIGIVTALIMKVIYIPGADILALCTMVILACLYYPLGFLFFNQIRLRHIFKAAAYKDVTALRIVLAIVTGIGLSTVVIGSLFKLLYFTGANEMLLAGLIATGIAFTVSLVIFMKNKAPHSRFILLRTGILGVIGIILLFVS